MPSSTHSAVNPEQDAMHEATHADLVSRLQRGREAQSREPLPSWPTRARRLRALEQMLLEQRASIVAAINADFGCRPREETELLEVFPSLSAIRHALAHGRRWMKPHQRLAGLAFLPARTELRPQPLGVVGIIVPWNYPLYLAVGPLVDALVAGNRVMVKMSEFTPRFSALFAELIGKYFQPDEVAVVTGDAEVAQAFSALPFDHLLFTGSTAVGHHVMRAAAANLTPVTLELGGKSPAIIGPGARLEHAVERIVLGKLLNAGQTCIAPDYVLVAACAVARVHHVGHAHACRGCIRNCRRTRNTPASSPIASTSAWSACATAPWRPVPGCMPSATRSRTRAVGCCRRNCSAASATTWR